MKKSFFSVSFAFMLAATVYAQDITGNNRRGKMPEPVTISGTVKITNVDKRQVALVVTDNGKEYVLMGVQGSGDEERPRPPQDGSKAPPAPRNEGEKRPSPVKMEDLAAFDGKKATLTGFFPEAGRDAPPDAPARSFASIAKDGAFMLTSCSAN